MKPSVASIVACSPKITSILSKLTKDQILSVCDSIYVPHKSHAISEGRKEELVDKAGDKRVFTFTMGGNTFCFFADMEQEILDRLSVAEIMFL